MQQDMTITCVDCGTGFVFTAAEQEFFAKKQLTQPKRCKSCRAAKKARMNQQQERR